ncbi:MAG: hypothetical protein MJA83_13315, partial [Gammaproteobacteria bacterium]|nr:hypothetical protein [Gammaproteobacteria bacterium]
MNEHTLGVRHHRIEDKSLLTGKGRYADDIQLPGMLEAAFVRSPHAHATYKVVDTAAALALPGVHAVYGFDDVVSA